MDDAIRIDIVRVALQINGLGIAQGPEVDRVDTVRFGGDDLADFQPHSGRKEAKSLRVESCAEAGPS